MNFEPCFDKNLDFLNQFNHLQNELELLTQNTTGIEKIEKLKKGMKVLVQTYVSITNDVDFSQVTDIHHNLNHFGNYFQNDLKEFLLKEAVFNLFREKTKEENKMPGQFLYYDFKGKKNFFEEIISLINLLEKENTTELNFNLLPLSSIYREVQIKSNKPNEKLYNFEATRCAELHQKSLDKLLFITDWLTPSQIMKTKKLYQKEVIKDALKSFETLYADAFGRESRDGPGQDAMFRASIYMGVSYKLSIFSDSGYLASALDELYYAIPLMPKALKVLDMYISQEPFKNSSELLSQHRNTLHAYMQKASFENEFRKVSYNQKETLENELRKPEISSNPKRDSRKIRL